MKQENLFERSGVVWVVSDEVVFEVKGNIKCKQYALFTKHVFKTANDVLQAKQIIRESLLTMNIKCNLSVGLDVAITVLKNTQNAMPIVIQGKRPPCGDFSKLATDPEHKKLVGVLELTQ